MTDGQGTKHDQEKPRLELVPVSAIQALGSVLTHGAEKYRARNWERGLAWGRVYAAALRHLTAWWGGEDIDPESGLPHLHHALCNLAFLVEYETTHPDGDDRPKGEQL